MLLVCFVVVNAAIRFAAVPDASVIHGYDASSYLSPAKGMLAYGDYVRTEIPSVADTFTVPLYPALLAVNIFLFGEDAGLAAVIFLQLVALYATGLMTRCLVRPFYPKAAVFAQAIVVFNPNSLSTAHLIQTETVFTLLLTAAIFFLFRFGRTLELRPALISAVFVGLAGLLPASRSVSRRRDPIRLRYLWFRPSRQPVPVAAHRARGIGRRSRDDSCGGHGRSLGI